ncbi:o-succinylbenzoate synthase [bacterium]|nr:o-succinylbenzoate synthase [bacterium]MBU1984149.1 o-succinylbenzoate synthase [bacterium]
MRLLQVRCARRVLPLARPIFTSRSVITVRETIIVAIRDEVGRIGVGEVAPLPEFGTETLDSARYALQRISAYMPLPPMPEKPREMGRWLSNVELDYRSLPATYFGFQSALLGLQCLTFGMPLHRLFPEKARPSVPVNALVSGSSWETIQDAAGCAVEAGFRTLKIKVGTRSLTDDVNIVARLRHAFPDVHLRLDANGAWSVPDARLFLKAVEPFEIEYIEDPVQSVSVDALCELRRASSVPIALDDAARDLTLLLPLMRRHLVDVVVLKPATIGAYDLMIDLTFEARRCGIDVVFSSMLESSVGLSYIVNLAAVQGSPKRAQGVGTALLLDEDTLIQPLRPLGQDLALPDVRTLPQTLTEDLRADLGIE